MMYKIILFYLIFSSLLLCSFADENILIVTEEWAPYNYTIDGEITGFSTEIVENILNIINKNYEITVLPSMRTTYVLDTRPKTIMYSLFRTPDREEKYKWIGPLCDGSIYFYKRKDNNLKIETIEDLKNVGQISCRNAGLINDLLINLGFTNLDNGATESIQIYKKLLIGRSDIAISDTDLGVRYNLQLLNEDLEVLEKIPIKLFESELYIACSKDIPDTEIQVWQTAFDKLKSTGIYDSIFQKYNKNSVSE